MSRHALQETSRQCLGIQDAQGDVELIHLTNEMQGPLMEDTRGEITSICYFTFTGADCAPNTGLVRAWVGASQAKSDFSDFWNEEEQPIPGITSRELLANIRERILGKIEGVINARRNARASLRGDHTSVSPAHSVISASAYDITAQPRSAALRHSPASEDFNVSTISNSRQDGNGDQGTVLKAILALTRQIATRDSVQQSQWEDNHIKREAHRALMEKKASERQTQLLQQVQSNASATTLSTSQLIAQMVKSNE